MLSKAAPTADQVNEVFSDVRESLPQTLANLEVVIDLLKRYHTGVEQVLVLLPQVGSIAQTVAAPFPNEAALDLALAINQPPPCLTGFLPASEWRSPADTSLAPLPSGTYCKIPQDTPANSVRGARNIPCIDVPGKRAATPRECRTDKPYVPLGTNPWYGDPNQILTCPAPGGALRSAGAARHGDPGAVGGHRFEPGARQPVRGGDAAADQRPAAAAGFGHRAVQRQQPNPCVYTPGGPPTRGIQSPER